jgi:cellulose synthase/poly-beta-1,6-N-acetylglucosamine synthase-like glycosyltransferase
MIYIFYLLAAILVFFSYKSLRGGINYLDFFRKELTAPKSEFTPFVSIIVPCRGVDEGLKENLAALFRQDFPAYEIIFAVDAKTDESVAIIENIVRVNVKNARNERQTKLIVAGKAKNESQKVHNLREAVRHIADESEIFVFVDSDARPSADWLRALVAPLRNEKIGAATGYRWFVSKKRNFASELRSAWNASIASALGANTESNFCWGGSMAIRRATFTKLNIRDAWRGVLSDDFTVTRAMEKAGLPIRFVPQALTVSIEDCNASELFEFTTRQMKITRVYAPNLWLASLLGSFLFNLVFVWGIYILIFYTANEFAFWFALAALLLVCVFSVGKANLRLNAVKLALKNYENELNKQFWTQNTLWIFAPAVFLYNDISAFFSRQIVWRGIRYELKSPVQTSIIEENARLDEAGDFSGEKSIKK